MVWSAAAKEFESVPRAWKWLSDREAIFSFDGFFYFLLLKNNTDEPVTRRICFLFL